MSQPQDDPDVIAKYLAKFSKTPVEGMVKLKIRCEIFQTESTFGNELLVESLDREIYLDSEIARNTVKKIDDAYTALLDHI